MSDPIVRTPLAQGALKLRTTLDEVRASYSHNSSNDKLTIYKLSKKAKDIYEIATELVDEIDDLEKLRENSVNDATPELNGSLARLAG